MDIGVLAGSPNTFPSSEDRTHPAAFSPEELQSATGREVGSLSAVVGLIYVFTMLKCFKAQQEDYSQFLGLRKVSVTEMVPINFAQEFIECHEL